MRAGQLHPLRELRPTAPRYPHPAWLDHGEAPSQAFSVLRKEFHHRRGESPACTRRKADEHHASHLTRGGVHELTKVLVFGEQDALFGDRQRDHILVAGAAMTLHDGRDIVASLPQRPHDGEVAALVCEQTHASAFGNRRVLAQLDCVLVSNRVSTVGNCGLDVVGRQTGIAVQNVRFRGTFR
jgi:hypothetical protein